MDGLCLKWNHHQLAFANTLKYAYEKDLFCDASIVCQGKLFPVHKIVLATSSEYFAEILSQIENEHPYIIVSDVNPAEIEALLNYMYRGEVNILEDNLASLISAAEMLRIKGLAVSDDISSHVSNEDLENSEKLSNQTTVTEEASPQKDEENTEIIPPKDIKKEEAVSDTECEVSNSNLPQQTSPLSESSLEIKSSDICFSPPIAVCKEEPQPMTVTDISTGLETVESEQKVTTEDHEQPMSVDFSQNNFLFGANMQTPSYPKKVDDPEMKYLSFPSNSASEVFGSTNTTEMTNLTENIPSTFDFMEFSPTNINSSKLCSPPKYSRSKSPRYCLLCPFVYITKEELKKHYAANHKGRKPFVCNFCSYQSFCTGTLNRHIKRHTGEKPYQCTSCSYKCAIKHNLTSHIIRAHPRGKTLD